MLRQLHNSTDKLRPKINVNGLSPPSNLKPHTCLFNNPRSIISPSRHNSHFLERPYGHPCNGTASTLCLMGRIGCSVSRPTTWHRRRTVDNQPRHQRRRCCYSEYTTRHSLTRRCQGLWIVQKNGYSCARYGPEYGLLRMPALWRGDEDILTKRQQTRT